jgi:hypothetical protein
VHPDSRSHGAVHVFAPHAAAAVPRQQGRMDVEHAATILGHDRQQPQVAGEHDEVDVEFLDPGPDRRWVAQATGIDAAVERALQPEGVLTVAGGAGDRRGESPVLRALEEVLQRAAGATEQHREARPAVLEVHHA